MSKMMLAAQLRRPDGAVVVQWMLPEDSTLFYQTVPGRAPGGTVELWIGKLGRGFVQIGDPFEFNDYPIMISGSMLAEYEHVISIKMEARA